MWARPQMPFPASCARWKTLLLLFPWYCAPLCLIAILLSEHGLQLPELLIPYLTLAYAHCLLFYQLVYCCVCYLASTNLLQMHPGLAGKHVITVPTSENMQEITLQLMLVGHSDPNRAHLQQSISHRGLAVASASQNNNGQQACQVLCHIARATGFCSGTRLVSKLMHHVFDLETICVV